MKIDMGLKFALTFELVGKFTSVQEMKNCRLKVNLGGWSQKLSIAKSC